jgi:ABC-type oligopeptide transport system substrate-binding subunit
VKGEIYHMKKNAFLLQLGIVGFLATSLSACGATVVTSSATSSSAAAASSQVASSEAASSEEASSATVYKTVAGTQDSGSFESTDIAGGGTGAFSYVGSNYQDRTTILGSLEKYAISHKLAGLPLYENGGYVLYNDRVVKGTNNYITGYGFSIVRDGYLSADMSATNEPNPAYVGYYHGWDQSDPGSINALDTDGSQIADMYANISSGYFGTKMNESKDGYEWYGVLASKDHPVPVVGGAPKLTGVTSNELHDTWRVYLRTGADGGVAYRTASKLTDRKAFDGTYATLDDYVNAWKVLLNKSNGYYRGGELAGKTGKSGIVGAAAYYNATAKGDTTDAAKAAWDNVGIKGGHDDANGDYIDFTFLAPTNRFYAMYNLAESNYEPIPAKFFNLVGAENYGNYNKDKTTTPIDNILSVGPYYLDTWQDQKLITYKRNADWYEIKEDANLYRIPGIHTVILSAYTTDNTVPFQEFLKGNLDAAGLPDDYLKDYKNDARATTVPGDSVFKLNINSCTKDRWVELFGKKGTIARTQESDYWDVKPWMSNDDFVKGLMFSIDRKTYAANRGVIPSANYFSTNYMSDPENGVAYDNTAEHIAAMKSYWGDDYADTFGYSVSKAEAAFGEAIDQLIASKDIVPGTKDAPTPISIDIWWMTESQIKKSGTEIGKYIEDAFNAAGLDKGVKLTVNQHAVTVWTDVYYKHLMVGQFDLGFGSISGNALDPLNFMEVLKSNNSSGFTLNWGPDTSAIDTGANALTFDNKTWSFDTLWKAADQGVVIKGGVELPPVVLSYGKSEWGDDLSLTLTFSYDDAKSHFSSLTGIGDATDLAITIDDFYVSDDSSYSETIDDNASYLTGCKVDETAKTITFTMIPELVQACGNAYGYVVVGADYTLTIAGVSVSGYCSAYVVLGE